MDKRRSDAQQQDLFGATRNPPAQELRIAPRGARRETIRTLAAILDRTVGSGVPGKAAAFSSLDEVMASAGLDLHFAVGFDPFGPSPGIGSRRRKCRW